MQRWKVWFAVVVLFLSGVTVGVAATLVVGRQVMLKMADEGPAASRRALMRKLRWSLELTPEQSKALEREIARVQLRVLELRAANSEPLVAALERGMEGMSKHLDPNQQEELSRMYNQFLARILPKEQWREELRSAGGE